MSDPNTVAIIPCHNSNIIQIQYITRKANRCCRYVNIFISSVLRSCFLRWKICGKSVIHFLFLFLLIGLMVFIWFYYILQFVSTRKICNGNQVIQQIHQSHVIHQQHVNYFQIFMNYVILFCGAITLIHFIVIEHRSAHSIIYNWNSPKYKCWTFSALCTMFVTLASSN